jgi:hypothetical protein
MAHDVTEAALVREWLLRTQQHGLAPAGDVQLQPLATPPASPWPWLALIATGAAVVAGVALVATIVRAANDAEDAEEELRETRFKYNAAYYAAREAAKSFDQKKFLARYDAYRRRGTLDRNPEWDV